MTTPPPPPPQPPEPPPQPPVPQQPPAPPQSQQPPGPQQQPAGGGGDSPADRALAEERARVKGLERELAALRQSAMTDDERRLAEARAEGRTEAQAEHARVLAAEMFRTAAAGRLADPDTTLEALDLSKLLKDGQPDRRRINALVDKLAAAAPAAPPVPGRIPAGALGATPTDDWLGTAMRQH
jgi:hypothetical protein